MIIAIDGLAASGKGRLAAGLAEHLGLPRLDTGQLYRAAGLACLAVGADLADEVRCGQLAAGADVEAYAERSLASREAAQAASRIGAHAKVRAALFGVQRAFALRPGGAILDGRDIGTVIAPEADVKFWLRADIETRAQRRWRDRVEDGAAGPIAAIAQELAQRDETDTGRADAPAMPAADAVVIDTEGKTAQAVFAQAMQVIETVRSA